MIYGKERRNTTNYDKIRRTTDKYDELRQIVDISQKFSHDKGKPQATAKIKTMDEKTLSQRISSLASDPKKRTKISRIMDVIDSIETSLAAGVSQSYIVDELVAGGLEISLKSFSSILAKIRKKRGKPSASPSKSEPNKAKESTVQESKKNDEPEPKAENDYDEYAVLSAREKRERRIAEFINEPPTNPLLHLLKDHKK